MLILLDLLVAVPLLILMALGGFLAVIGIGGGLFCFIMWSCSGLDYIFDKIEDWFVRLYDRNPCKFWITLVFCIIGFLIFAFFYASIRLG